MSEDIRFRSDEYWCDDGRGNGATIIGEFEGEICIWDIRVVGITREGATTCSQPIVLTIGRSSIPSKI